MRWNERRMLMKEWMKRRIEEDDYESEEGENKDN